MILFNILCGPPLAARHHKGVCIHQLRDLFPCHARCIQPFVPYREGYVDDNVAS